MLPTVGNKAKFKYQFRSRLYLKIFCGLVTLVSAASLIQFIPTIAAIKDQLYPISLPESKVEGLISKSTGRINLQDDKQLPEVQLADQDTLTELFDIGTAGDSSSGRYFRIRRDSKANSLNLNTGSSDTVLIQSNSSSPIKKDQHGVVDLRASASSISRIDRDHSHLFNTENDGSITPVGAPELQGPSLAELTAVGTAAGLLVGDLAAKANDLAARQAQLPDDTNQEGIERQDAAEEHDSPLAMEPRASVEQGEPARAHDQTNLDQMPDSIESLMSSEMGSDNEKDDSNETEQKADYNHPEQPKLDAPQVDEPDEGQVTQDSRNYQDTYPVSTAGLSPQDLALLQENAMLGYNQAPNGNLVAPIRDSYSDLSSAAGHHYGYKKKKKKKVKKVKKKKKVVIKKKKVKKYKVKVVKYKKKKKKKVKKMKKPKKHHHHHDHGKYYM